MKMKKGHAYWMYIALINIYPNHSSEILRASEEGLAIWAYPHLYIGITMSIAAKKSTVSKMMLSKNSLAVRAASSRVCPLSLHCLGASAHLSVPQRLLVRHGLRILAWCRVVACSSP